MTVLRRRLLECAARHSRVWLARSAQSLRLVERRQCRRLSSATLFVGVNHDDLLQS